MTIIPIIPYLNIEYYTLEQISQLTGWTKHNVSQRSNACKFERVTDGVYTRQSVDRYLLARALTELARQDGYKSPHLLWPDENGAATSWNGHTYTRRESANVPRI